MKKIPNVESCQHAMHSIRLRNYDYAQAGRYFITVCLQNRECLFGKIVNSEMILNDAGRMISDIWHQIPGNYPGVEIDEFVVMPNHIHGIVVLVGADPCVCPTTPCVCPKIPGVSPTTPDTYPNTTDSCKTNHTSPSNDGLCPIFTTPTTPCISHGQSRGIAPTLPGIVQRFKTLTTKLYIDGVYQKSWQYFETRLWQHNYYEHVIRDEDDLNRVREYISANHLNWTSDAENPDNVQ